MSTTITTRLDETPEQRDSAGVARSEPVIWWVGCQGACVVGPFDWVVMRGVVWLRLAGRPARPRVFATVVSLICGDWVPQDLDFVARSAV